MGLPSGLPSHGFAASDHFSTAMLSFAQASTAAPSSGPSVLSLPSSSATGAAAVSAGAPASALQPPALPSASAAASSFEHHHPHSAGIDQLTLDAAAAAATNSVMQTGLGVLGQGGASDPLSDLVLAQHASHSGSGLNGVYGGLS